MTSLADDERGDLRVIDAGNVSALRSQTLWHAVARGVSNGAPPTLVLARPTQPYVCVGFHRRLEELDLAECRRRSLPVFRRMVGGGPVYLDDGQLFFALVLPARSVSPARAKALRTLLAPAVAAFRSVGVDAELDDAGEIVVGDRKICGHGAGQLDDAVVVVGNLIERFDHDAAAAILATPDRRAKRELRRLMGRYVAATPADPYAFADAAIEAYARTLGLTPRPGVLRPDETRRLAHLDGRFRDAEWVLGPSRPEPPLWQVKVRAGVSVFSVEHDGARVVGTVVFDRLESLSISDRDLAGHEPAVEESLVGCSLGQASDRLRPFGPSGERVAQALAKCEGRPL